MHASVDAPPNPIGPDLMDSMSAVEASIVDVEPGPVSPVGFAVLAGLVGMAGGMVLAPWLERWFRRMQRNDE
jgi:hypothetical protein